MAPIFLLGVFIFHMNASGRISPPIHCFIILVILPKLILRDFRALGAKINFAIRPGPAFTKIEICARGANLNFAARPGPAFTKIQIRARGANLNFAAQPGQVFIKIEIRAGREIQFCCPAQFQLKFAPGRI